jgi:hypothetical protein
MVMMELMVGPCSVNEITLGSDLVRVRNGVFSSFKIMAWLDSEQRYGGFGCVTFDAVKALSIEPRTVVCRRRSAL